MEVHHHPHVEKKSFKEYLLEGLMIFLAVSMGFIAENIREHITENTRAKEYLNSYKDELLQNQILFKRNDSLMTFLIPAVDSITDIYYKKTENKNLQILARLLDKARSILYVPITNSNYVQIVNSGNLRLIGNKDIISTMLKYNDVIEIYKAYNTKINDKLNSLVPDVLKIEDTHDFYRPDSNGHRIFYTPQMDKFLPLTNEQRRLIIGYYKLYYVSAVSDLSYMKRLLNTNTQLLNLITKEYHLEKE